LATENNYPVVRAPGDGTLYSAVGVDIIFKVMSGDTGGRYAFYEYLAPAGFAGPPPHTHAGFDEAWYVLEGELQMRVGEQQVAAPAGTFLHVPGATVHAFANPGQAPARFLGLLIPGGFERSFSELPEIVAQHSYPPPAAVMAELSRKYGIVNAPPPGSRQPDADREGSFTVLDEIHAGNRDKDSEEVE
jgi:mannose-6-phosphate isomerase-like protein (cupin superfamily)